MPTRLSKYCEGVMEAAWLVAVVAVPIFFNVYSSRIFEPDKIMILRSLALIILTAWIVKIIEAGGIHWERLTKSATPWENLKHIPMLLPVIALIVVYGLATIFSVTPRVSLWGSYQRLQGTFTTFSYIVVFAAIAVNVRRREQIDRLLTAIILASLPVSLYGVLQRYRIDPVPWGGDVSVRIAANMGNSIFVAAYYIMVSPLTVGRIIESFLAILNEDGNLLANCARATGYVFIASLQVIALLFSGSRGPLLGWLAGLFFLFMMLSLLWRKRWLTISVVATAALLGVFLVLFNISGGPLESLRALPGIGRLGHLVDEGSKTSRVRTLIWQGAAQLVLPHNPLEYPDGHLDAFHVLRPLIGYGPESMFVAYSPFFPPELTQVEKRGRTPDRSHNETWDSLITTGTLGLLVYLSLFVSIFYFGLKALRLLNAQNQRRLFFGLVLGGGALGAAGFIIWRGVGYFGVGLPFGMVFGLFSYLVWLAISGNHRPILDKVDRPWNLVIASLLAAILAHFVEINFGIAIAITRLYFWVFSAMVLVIATLLLCGEANLQASESEVKPSSASNMPSKPQRASLSRLRHKTSKSIQTRITYQTPNWLPSALVGAGISAMILLSLGFDFTTNLSSRTSTIEVLWTSMINLPTARGAVSYGVLTMILTTWLMTGIVLASEEARLHSPAPWWKVLAVILCISLVIAGLYWFWHAAGLVNIVRFNVNQIKDVLTQLQRLESILNRYYLYHLILIFSLSAPLVLTTPLNGQRLFRRGIWVAPICFLLACYLIWSFNLRVVHADMAYKRGEAYSNQGAWQPAIAAYQHALTLAPYEDFYYLSLAKAYADYGASLKDQTERDILFNQATNLLKQAQAINPLNTDHTANLARLHNAWAQNTPEATLKDQRARLADEYFARALVLSPHNSTLWLEWAFLYMNVFRDRQEAYSRLLKASELDPLYDRIHAALGDYYAQTALNAQEKQQKETLTRQAVEQYRLALKYADPNEVPLQYAYIKALASAYVQLGEFEMAIPNFEQAIQLMPNSSDRWIIEETIGRLYAELENKELALTFLLEAMQGAPQDQRERIEGLIIQLQSQP